MDDGAETQPWDGNGLGRQTNGLDEEVAAGSVHRLEAPAPTQSVAALAQRLNRLTEEVAESRHQGEQLEAALEKTTRRVHQLIGERNRLTSLLAERDAELQRLNRELGALAERATPVARGSPALLEAARAMLEKIRRARGASRRARSNGAQPKTVSRASHAGALVPWAQNGPPKAVLGVAVFGLSEAEIEKVLGVIDGYCAERDLAPLLLTDNDAFQLFRGRRVLFEFLPARADQERLAPDLDWRHYTLRRLALIRRKWQPLRVVAFGRRAAEVVQLWRDSPFEETPVPAALDGPSAGAELAWRPAQPGAAVQP